MRVDAWDEENKITRSKCKFFNESILVPWAFSASISFYCLENLSLSSTLSDYIHTVYSFLLIPAVSFPEAKEKSSTHQLIVHTLNLVKNLRMYRTHRWRDNNNNYNILCR